MKKVMLVISVLVIFSGVTGYLHYQGMLPNLFSTPEMKFENAKTIDEYKKFIDEFPNHSLINKAKDAVDDLTWLNTTVHWEETFTYAVSTGVGLFDAFSGGGIKESFVVTFFAVVKANLGDKVEAVIQSAKVTGGKHSYKGAEQYRYHTSKTTTESIGQNRVLDKKNITQNR